MTSIIGLAELVTGICSITSAILIIGSKAALSPKFRTYWLIKAMLICFGIQSLILSFSWMLSVFHFHWIYDISSTLLAIMTIVLLLSVLRIRSIASKTCNKIKAAAENCRLAQTTEKVDYNGADAAISESRQTLEQLKGLSNIQRGQK